jgi:hypothetical protein
VKTLAPLSLGSILLLAAVQSGCNIVGPAVYFIHGPAKTPPQFELPKDKPAVVFVDDRGNVLPNRSTRQRIAHAAEQALLGGKAVGKGDILSSDAILSIAAQERFGKPTGIAEIGKAVGASTVIYATVDSFGISPNGQEYAPFATLRVKVIDVESRQRIWPTEDREWAPLSVSIADEGRFVPTSSSDRATAEYKLADQTGLTLARMFIEWVPEDVAQRVGD